MNSVTEHLTCPNCGAAIPANAPQEVCPKCLMAAAAASTEDGQTGGKRPEAPSLERLAAAFPQLEVIELIGQGGMGAVYKVRQKQLDRIVALKVLPPGIGGDPSFAERFTREAKALAKLLHPNIVALFEFGQADGIYYLLMEYVDGVSLGQLLRASRVSAREALAIVPQICDALQYAHDQGIVHRDIKPENILLDRRGRVKVADFGLAKLVKSDAPLTPALSPSDGERVAAKPAEGKAPMLTGVGKIMGTPNYMAPEQVEHPGEVDHRADIYALGVVFYQMLTGELPGKRIEAPSKKVQIDVRLDEVVLRALEKDPGRRYSQASVLKTQVETIASDMRSATAPPIGTAAKDGAVEATTPCATKKKKGEFIGIGCAIQALGIACFFIPPVGWILGIILLLLGSRMALKLLCSHCGNPTTREARICTTCGAHFLPKGASAPSNAQTPRRAGGWAKYAYVGAAVGIPGALAIWFGLRHMSKAPEPLEHNLTQHQFEQLVDSNQIAEAAVYYNSNALSLNEIAGRYYVTDAEGKRLPETDPHTKVPFRTKVRMYPELQARLLTIPQLDWNGGTRNPGLVILVSATAARKGDLSVRLDTLGTVESSNSVMFVIPEHYCQEVIKKFDAHQALTVEADNHQGERFGHGLLAGVDNRIDTETATLKCRASLIPEGGNLMVPGLFLNVHLLLEVKHGVVFVPADAISHDPQGAFVWAIKPDQTVSVRHVQAGTIDGAKVEIQDGLSPGEVVVTGGSYYLREGQKILYNQVLPQRDDGK